MEKSKFQRGEWGGGGGHKNSIHWGDCLKRVGLDSSDYCCIITFGEILTFGNIEIEKKIFFYCS